MKTIDRIKSTFISIKDSVKRFPVTIIISSILAIVLIYLSDTNPQASREDLLLKISLILGLGIFLSFIIGLGLERYKRDLKTSIIAYLLGGLALTGYYFLFLNDLNLIFFTRYFASLLAMFLIAIYIQRIKRDDGYEYYVMDIISEIAITIIYSMVLYIGFSVILFTLNTLFELELAEDLYLYIFIIVVFVFAVALFLSKFPRIDQEYESVNYTSALRVLLTYIVIPLISIYTAILYVYFAKILLTREWPQGLVSHLVLWYSAVSVGVLFLINPISRSDKISSLFRKIFPKAVIPVLVMMFLSIGKRVSQYGITENRYYVLALGLWVLAMMLYYGFKDKYKNSIMPISLSLLLLLSVYGPISSFAISKYSQNKRFESILEVNNMLSNGNIVASSEISSKDKRQLNNIMSYFINQHDVDDIKVLPNHFETKDMKSLMGFEYEPYNRYGYNEEEYIYYGLNRLNKPIDVSGYDYYIELDTWATQSIDLSDFELEYDREENILELIFDGDKLEFDIAGYARKIYDKQSQLDETMDSKESEMDLKDMTFDINVDDEYGYIDLKLIFTNINGQIDSENTLNLENCEFIILVNISDK